MSTQTYHFQKLTPKNDVELGIYEDALEYAFANKDVRNIAISGAYGAGKSSVVETYKRKHPEKTFLHISLAHFIDETSGEKEIAAKDLEGKIINQLVHQIAPEKIPQTNFIMKKQADEKNIVKATVAIVVFALLCCFAVFHEGWCKLVEGLSWSLLRNLLAFTTAKELVLLCGILCTVMLIYACYHLIKRQANRSILQKLNVKGGHLDIELFDEKVDSYFDKYLNEVLYLFERAEADAFVFEDMDRYDNSLIFEKLREINVLLNRRREQLLEEKGNSIRFVYQLRDDMFVTKERTKFFDFIIPIVPVVDGSNSLDQFLKYFEESGIRELFEIDFLRGLSAFVDDMRILKNICNEFGVYHEKLQESQLELNNNKLLAMVVYKNIFPRDFIELQVSQGYVYQLFQEKEGLVEKRIKEIDAEIEKLEEAERASVAEYNKNLDELDAVYYVNSNPIKVKNKTAEQFGSRAEFVAAIKNNNYVVSIGKPEYYSSDYRWTETNIKSRFEALSSNPEYMARKKAIEGKEHQNKQKRAQAIMKNKMRREELKGDFLNALLTRENEEDYFRAPKQVKEKGEEDFRYIKCSPYFELVKFLIRDGHIDETYQDYMTFFYGEHLSRQDKIFLNSVVERKAKEYDYALQNASLVIRRMRLQDFEEEESWNYDLLDGLFANSSIYKEQMSKFMRGLRNYEPAGFVDGYLARTCYVEAFVKAFNQYWSRACVWITGEGDISEAVKKRYVLETLCQANDTLLAECNKDGELVSYIISREDFLNVDAPYISDARLNGIAKSLIALGVKFVAIDMQGANLDLLQTVYENNLYVLSERMIAAFLEYQYRIPVSEEYQTKNLSLILSQEEPMAEYVKENLGAYIDTYIGGDEPERYGTLCESAETMLLVLNEEALEQEVRIAFCKMQETKLPRLVEVQDKELWKELLPTMVGDSAENLCDYFYLSGNEMDEALVDYINAYRGVPALVSEELDAKYGEDSGSKLFWAIVVEEGLANDKYIEIINGFELQINKISTVIAKEKMALLIAEDCLNMNADNLKFVRGNYQELVCDFIDSGIENYLEVAQQDDLSAEEIVHVLKAGILDEDKIRAIGKSSQAIPVVGKGYSDELTAYILQNHLDEDEKPQLYHWYPAKMPQTREEILKLAMEDIETVVMPESSARAALLDALLQDEEVPEEDKERLLGMKKGKKKSDAF